MNLTGKKFYKKQKKDTLKKAAEYYLKNKEVIKKDTLKKNLLSIIQKTKKL